MGALSLIVTAVVVRISAKTAARATDRGLGTKDAFVASMEFGDSESPFASAVVQRAEQLATGRKPSEAVPLPVERGASTRVALLGVGVAVLSMISNPQDAIRERLARDHKVLEAAADRLDDKAAELKKGTAAQKDVAKKLERAAH